MLFSKNNIMIKIGFSLTSWLSWPGLIYYKMKMRVHVIIVVTAEQALTFY